jgi:hypothetical protein
MATITGLTAARMQEIIDGTIVDADVIGDHLILTKEDGSTIDTGVVKGDPGAPGAPGANASNLGKGAAFPGGATDGDLFVRTDQAGDPLYKYTDGAWTISAGGLSKVTAFPGAPTDGDVVVRTDLNGSPMFAYSTENGWEQQPRMGAVTVPAVSIASSGAQGIATGVPSVIGWDTELFDTDGMHDPRFATLTGTIAKTAGQNNLVGTGTLFTTELSVGDPIRVGGEVNVVASITSNTAATVRSNWSTTASGQTYTRDNTLVQIKTPGVYRLSASIDFSNSSISGTNRRLYLRVNGVIVAKDSRIPHTTDYTYLQVNKDIRLAAGDIVDIQAYQDSGGSLTVINDGSASPFLNATWLGGPGQTVDERGVPAVRLYGTSHGALVSGVEALLTFDSESYDTDSMHDPAVNPTRITIKTPGLYRFSGQVSWPTNANGYRELIVRRNGAIVAVADNSAAGPTQYQQFQAVIMCAGGDYIEVGAIHSAGSNLTPAAGVGITWFAAEMVGSGKTVTPYARVYRNAQSVPSATNTAIGFDVEDADNDSIHDTVTNNSRLVCRTAGVYAILGSAAFTTSSGYIQASIAKNGSVPNASGSRIAGSAQTSVLPIHELIELAVGDYVELIINQNSGGALTMESRLQMVKVGAPIAGQTGIDPVEATHVVGGAGEPAFTNGYVNNTSGYTGASFYKDRGRVYLAGMIKSGTPGLSAFTLPIGYRPSAAIKLPMNINGAMQSVDINPDGTVVPTGGSAADTRILEGLSFKL